MSSAIVIGATSAIGQALTKQLLLDDSLSEIFQISRQIVHAENSRTQCLTYDGSADTVPLTCEDLASRITAPVTQVFICLGTLHGELDSPSHEALQYGPEKQLEALQADSFHHVMHVNAFLPLLWLAHLRPILASKTHCVVTVFSARVGSISDNQSGGWYSYRMSKSALNMGVKSAAIEYRRRASNVKLLLFQPGTTDTPLSRPFQRNVNSDELRSPEFVAQKLLGLINRHPADGTATFLDWQNELIPW